MKRKGEEKDDGERRHENPRNKFKVVDHIRWLPFSTSSVKARPVDTMNENTAELTVPLLHGKSFYPSNDDSLSPATLFVKSTFAGAVNTFTSNQAQSTTPEKRGS